MRTWAGVRLVGERRNYPDRPAVRSREYRRTDFEHPAPFFKRRLLRFDSLLELVVGIESEHRQSGQPHALLLAAGGIDDGLAVAVDLIDPEAGRVLDAAAGCGAEQLRLHPFGDFAQIGGHRIVGRRCQDPEHDRARQCRRDELPGGNAGGACDHQLQPPRKRQIAGHRSDQDAKRHHLFEQLRNPEQRRFRDCDGGCRQPAPRSSGPFRCSRPAPAGTKMLANTPSAETTKRPAK